MWDRSGTFGTSLLLATALVALAGRVPPGAQTAMTPQAASKSASFAGPVTSWPRPIPVRLKPQGRDEMLVVSLGEVSTPLADGIFDPTADRVTMSDGRTIDYYFERHLRVPFFRPLDKSIFPVPPSGWCA